MTPAATAIRQQGALAVMGAGGGRGQPAFQRQRPQPHDGLAAQTGSRLHKKRRRSGRIVAFRAFPEQGRKGVQHAGQTPGCGGVFLFRVRRVAVAGCGGLMISALAVQFIKNIGCADHPDGGRIVAAAIPQQTRGMTRQMFQRAARG